MDKEDIIQFTQMQESITNIERSVNDIKTENKLEHQEIKQALIEYKQYGDDHYAPMWVAEVMGMQIMLICTAFLTSIIYQVIKKPKK